MNGMNLNERNVLNEEKERKEKRKGRGSEVKCSLFMEEEKQVGIYRRASIQTKEEEFA